ncbi:MAG: hypothetical protein QXY87_08565 [Saccharolobus sp.]|uniref:Integral membrane protein n=2 Tax=Saccharolobus shibatae TaxID=2286 RepID=A0A8F5BM69_SACSH|nr:hypothetical protein [Saccharolobus shibatae]MCH4815707.1 hypothetical protein [Saccharolobus shibatae]QXJ27860.1 putative integral membrane protein [Saccharolobus shibatae B12]QXJ31175.1 putative integral membrane protein [Saccharolobus shibatae]QXJ34190.1 putative integral membrane protein [Saccharolobus shibatae]
MDVSVFLAALGISLLELTEAGAIAAIYHNIYKNNLPFIYAVLGVAVVLIPTFTVGRLIYLVPLNYVLLASAVILFYFGYRLIRSARRSFKGIRKKGEEKEEGLSVVFTVSAIEGFEAALVILALIPQSYSSALMGAILASFLVVVLTAILKSQVARIRLPHLKFVLSALLFSLGTLWISEVVFDIPDVILPLFFLAYLGINYAIIKI